MDARDTAETPPVDWWQGFFDSDYLRLWSELTPVSRTEEEADGVWKLLGLAPGARILDAPCGYGRVAAALARRGARVLGVDLSATLLGEAARRRGDLPSEQLAYLRHDLRVPLAADVPHAAGGFDAAVNVFTSLGYGSEADDLAILRTLAGAVRPGGHVLVETMHRDAVAVFLAKGVRPAQRYADGTLLVEEPRLDPVAGRIETAWHWAGPHGAGVKRASIRIYTITELVRLLERAGLVFEAAHAGCTPEPFRAAGAELGGRVGLLARRP